MPSGSAAAVRAGRRGRRSPNLMHTGRRSPPPLMMHRPNKVEPAGGRASPSPSDSSELAEQRDPRSEEQHQILLLEEGIKAQIEKKGEVTTVHRPVRRK